MTDGMKLILSVARLTLVLSLLAGASAAAANAELPQSDGGCQSASGSGLFCAAGSVMTASSKCVVGQSGGCETCESSPVQANTCFSSGGMQHHYYIVAQQ